MSTKWYCYHGTSPIVRVGGDNTLRGQDSRLGGSAGVTQLAGAITGRRHEFARNVTWDLSLRHFLRKSTRAALDSYLNDQRIDLFGRLINSKHDLYLSKKGSDFEYVMLNSVAADVNTESVNAAGLIDGGAGQGRISSPVYSCILGDLSYWSDENPKYGTWSLYNDTADNSYAHSVPTTSTHADMGGSTTFTFMGWIKSTGTGNATQYIFRKQGTYVLALVNGVFTFTWRGATAVTFSGYTFPIGNNRWYFVAISVTGTTINLYVGGDWETSLTNVASTTGTGSASNANPLMIGCNGNTAGTNNGDDSFIGYLGPMVFVNTLVSGTDIEAQFDATKQGQAMFADIADAIYGSPTKALYYDMQRRTSFESVLYLMLTKQYNVFAGNATPTDGAIQLDHQTRISNVSSIFAGGTAANQQGQGDRLFMGKLTDFTDSVGYSDNSEIAYVTAKDVAPADVYQPNRISLRAVGLATTPVGGFRADHANGQSLLIKFAQRWPGALIESIEPEPVDGLARGHMREVNYAFGIDRFPFTDNSVKNYDDALDLHYSVYRNA